MINSVVDVWAKNCVSYIEHDSYRSKFGKLGATEIAFIEISMSIMERCLKFSVQNKKMERCLKFSKYRSQNCVTYKDKDLTETNIDNEGGITVKLELLSC